MRYAFLQVCLAFIKLQIFYSYAQMLVNDLLFLNTHVTGITKAQPF